MSARAFLAVLDPRGRLSRRAYGRALVRLGLIATALLCLCIVLAAGGWRSEAFLALGTVLILVWTMAAATARRLHDRDRSASWLVVFGFVYATSFAPIETWVEPAPVIALGLALGIFGFSAWFLIETLGRRGTIGSNRYGPEPYRAESGEPARDQALRGSP